MIKKISKHINWVLSDKKYDDDYKREMINVCVEEYQISLKKGLSKNEAYLYAIKDFDNEYYKEKIDNEKNKVNFKTLFLPLGVSISFVLSYLLCTQFISEKVFIWSIWVFAIPNLIFIFICNIFNLATKKYNIKIALSNILFMLILYLPFILIELKGNKFDFTNYIITFTFCMILGIIFYMIKNKFINCILLVILFVLLTILLGYYVVFTRIYVVEFILKILMMISFIVICILSLRKEKYNNKKIFFSILFLILISVIFFCIGDLIQIYAKYIVLSIALIIIMLVLKFLNVKLFEEYSFVIYIFISFICFATICRDISIFYSNELMSTMNYYFLACAVIFLAMILLQKYLHKKIQKGVEN